MIMFCNDKIKNRLKRAEGQMHGIMQMIDNDTACLDILTQLKAVRSSIDKTIGLLTAENLVQTIENNLKIKLENINDAVDLIVKGK